MVLMSHSHTFVLTSHRNSMKLIHSIKYILLIVSLALSSSLFAADLPNPELMGSDAKKHHLKDFLGKGKWTAVIVWGPKCPACIEEMPDIQGLYDDRERTNINVLGLVVDFPTFSYAKIKQVQQFEEDYFITFPNLLISSSLFYELGLGRLQGTPTIILVDPKGKVSAMQLGGVPRGVMENHVARQEEKINLLSKKQ